MKISQPAADSVQEPKHEASESKDTYRAPNRVALGTAVGLVQFAMFGPQFDAQMGGGRTYSR